MPRRQTNAVSRKEAANRPARNRNTEKARAIGPPRDLAGQQSILSATMRLLQTVPIADLAIETVAREAEVSKATVYRWWKSKGALVVDAFMESHFSNTPMPEGVDPRTALKQHLTSLVRYFSSSSGKVVVQILLEGHRDGALMADFNERFSKTVASWCRQFRTRAGRRSFFF